MALKYTYMALKHKDLLTKLKSEPLSTNELKIIKEVEDYIDKEIKKQFYGKSVNIDLSVAKFKYNPNTRPQIVLAEPRRVLMSKELDKRYKAAGWKIKFHIDDMLDGPNMSGGDYWVLSGK